MRICIFMMTVFLSVIPAAAPAQMSASKDAQYLATIKAVANYKIDDEEELRNVERLRENEAFNRQLQRMMGKLQNTRTKNSKNQRVLQILKQAGKEIYDILK